ncbi:MAG: MarR family transcriptional regulator [Aquisalimonadaceae bacterium]
MPNEENTLEAIYRRAGFRIRRCHQIAVSIFLDECKEFELTTTQFGLMMAIHQTPGIDQINLSRVIGLDRSTTATVVDRMFRRGLLRRDPNPEDRRKNRISLTDEGERILGKARAAADRAHDRLLAPLAADERDQLLDLLQRILDANNVNTRVPLGLPDRQAGKE